MQLALESVEEGFKVLAEGNAANSARTRLPLPTGVFNFMSAVAPGMGVFGIKAYGIARGNPVKFWVQISSTETGELLAIVDAGDMGQIRTGAASGVATKYMAKESASSVGVIGSGYQARTQLEAVCAVRDIKSAKVFSRTEERRDRFASRMSEKLGIDVTASDSAEACVDGTDVVITMTSTSQPVLRGEWLQPGMHINAAGANHWMRRELDGVAVSKADIIVTDDINQAKAECGDILFPVETGHVRWDQVRSMADVIGGRTPGRNSDDDITLFESQGIALEDIAAGIKIYHIAKERGIGTELPF